MRPAARRYDLTLHLPPIITGSPDTTIQGEKAARLLDIVAKCPNPTVPCIPPMGRIVSASTTVFVNKMGQARVGDKVLCGAAGSQGQEPPGGFHPPASGYSARREDHYEKLMEVEHEASRFDEEEAKNRQAYDGSRKQAEVPVGVPPAAVKPRPPSPPPPPRRAASKTKPRKPTDAPNPVAPKKAAKKKAPAKKSISMPALGAAGKTRVGQGVSGSALGAPTNRAPGQKPPEEKENNRRESQIDLRFPMNLRFGFRLAIPAPPIPIAPNVIVPIGALTVIVG
jgi:uncharacterized Zn-binding protein involved in type VI secretion